MEHLAGAATVRADDELGLGRTGPQLGKLDRLLRLADGVPLPAAVTYALLAIVELALAHLIVWSAGARPLGTLDETMVPAPILGAYFLWLLHTLNRVGAEAFDDFRPALGDDPRADTYRIELISIPDRMAVVAMLVSTLIIDVVYYLTVRPLLPEVPPLVDLVSAVMWAGVAATMGVIALHTIRQMRLVSRLSARAANVDIFRPGPINALSRLTAVTAVAVLVFIALFVVTNPLQPLGFILEEALIVALGVASFVLPLRAMHKRLQVEKSRLADDAQIRLKLTLARVHASIDTNDLSESERLHDSLATVLAERDVVAKLPTWPWSASTFRGFTSALLLPVVIFVITQLIARLL
ncbi:MAG: hypothetical protein ABIP53_09900 [Candidatus Limnocylindrales bacterium]